MHTFAAALPLCLAVASSLQAAPFPHDALDRVLRAHVDSTGRVDYAGLLAQRAGLDAYVDSLGAVSPHSAPDRFGTRADELAYWINAYNAFVLRGVIDAYPVDSVKDIGILNGFFRRKEFVAGGEAMTLDHIENEIIRPVYQDPRIHVAINCGAVSCPPLAARAYTGDSLHVQLERAMQRFARSPSYARLDAAAGTLHLSRILEWFRQDFVQWFPAARTPRPAKPTLIDYLMPYLPEATAAHLRAHPEVELAFDDYDWALNDQAK
jgi:hypothetical protein